MNLKTFGEKLGVTAASISLIESEKRQLTDQMIKLICREFNVNESWLRTGEGDMFRQYTRDEEIAAFIGSIQMNEDDGDDFKRQVIAGLAALDTEEWKVLERIAMKMMKMNLDKKND